MLLKTADDKSKRLALLEDLQRSPMLQASQKKWLREELMRLRKGIQGEKESAYFLDQYFKGGENHVVLHDLRFLVDGDVAQIDHLVINRGIGMYLLETKNYAGSSVHQRSGRVHRPVRRRTLPYSVADRTESSTRASSAARP